tara:strand:+ start:346 stop:681 length:336 start_codon:yes stop_codon:yes gene_type:complete
MSDLKIDAKYIDWIDASVASSAKKGKTRLCYANPKKTNIHKQIAAFISQKKMPKTLQVTGGKNIKMKVACYQNDGFWFEEEKTKEGFRWRLWVEAEHLLSAGKQNEKEGKK